MRFLLGIDASKGYADITCIDEDETVILPNKQYYDSPKGYEALGKRLLGILEDNEEVEIYCGVESTGGYENNWFRFLQSLSNRILVTRINPKAVKSNGEAELVRTTTDAVSAKMIATYLLRFGRGLAYCNKSHQASEKCYEGRKFNKYIRRLLKDQTAHRNVLEKTLYDYFPSALSICKGKCAKWLLQVLSRYPSQQKVVRAGVSRLCKLKGVSEQQARKLITAIKKRKKQCTKMAAHLIAQQCKQILFLNKEITEQKKLLCQTYKGLEGVNLLKSVPGIGLQSAVELLLEIEDIGRFESAKKLCSYFGVHPIFKQSGDGVGKIRMSKKGRSAVRRVLFMSCLTSIKHSPMFRKIYAKHKAKGKNHYQAMGVIMHKMLRVVWALLTYKRVFDEQKDAALCGKADRLRELHQLANKLVEEVLDQDAPVSSRKAKNLKKQADVPIE